LLFNAAKEQAAAVKKGDISLSSGGGGKRKCRMCANKRKIYAKEVCKECYRNDKDN
jgi:hypothetical protein